MVSDAVKVSIFILFSKNTDACCRKGQLMEYILLLVGFILLIKGADFFVEGSSSLAGILKVPSVIIGLTIVAMGTSAPEASVSINAAQLYAPRRDSEAGYAVKYPGNRRIMSDVFRWQLKPY